MALPDIPSRPTVYHARCRQCQATFVSGDSYTEAKAMRDKHVEEDHGPRS